MTPTGKSETLGNLNKSQNMKIHILCYGNEYMGDDSAGIIVYDFLSKKKFPEHVKIFNAGISGSRSLSLFEGVKLVCIIDAISPNGYPGKIHFKRKRELISEAGIQHTAHDMDFSTLITHFELLNPRNKFVKIIFFGIEAKEITGFKEGCHSEILKSCKLLSEKISSYFSSN